MEINELVELIQNGREELISQLWNSIYKFVAWRVERFLVNRPDHERDLKEDAINESFFTLMDCVRKYDSDKGDFLSYFSASMEMPIRRVLFGCNSSERMFKFMSDRRQMRSLSEEISDASESLTIGATIPDPQAESKIYSIVEDSRTKAINEYMKRILDSVAEKEGAEIIKYMIDYDCRLSEAIQNLYSLEYIRDKSKYSEICGKVSRAKRQFRRKTLNYANKKEAYELELESIIFRQNYGVGRFKHSFTSGVEQSVIDREALMRKKRNEYKILFGADREN